LAANIVCDLGWYGRSPPGTALTPQFVVLLQLPLRDPPVLEASSHRQRSRDQLACGRRAVETNVERDQAPPLSLRAFDETAHIRRRSAEPVDLRRYQTPDPSCLDRRDGVSESAPPRHAGAASSGILVPLADDKALGSGCLLNRLSLRLEPDATRRLRCRGNPQIGGKRALISPLLHTVSVQQSRLLYTLLALRRVEGVRVAAQVRLDSGREWQRAQDRSQDFGCGHNLASFGGRCYCSPPSLPTGHVEDGLLWSVGSALGPSGGERRFA
jgi:hypothetical protein